MVRCACLLLWNFENRFCGETEISKYEQLMLLFLPEDSESLNQMLGEIKDKATPIYAGRLSDFEPFFDSFVKAKNQLKIFNSAIAFHAIAELALKELERMESEVIDNQEKADG